MNKYVESLEEFLKLDYKLVITPFEEEGEKGFIVSSPEINGLEVFGVTIDEALKEVNEAKQALFYLQQDKGEKIAYPKGYETNDENLSGRMTIRVPKMLHKRIKDYSNVNGTSLNTSIIQLLNDGFNYNETNILRENIIETLNNKLSFNIEYNMVESSRNVYTLFKNEETNLIKEPKFHYVENFSYKHSFEG
ncbi:type II toxin-antitoxin system HicB family antitoxin [Oceanobacillus neutriphilus]|uniref:Toxin-antitoxin system HicB family antitoxin n=1 Tax=Oceanobacillus neutriphilus TaxID=531815 RepID=A0ABQ2P3B6_9BACI|nr:toxin-antitoxin system HicB family antitoxin [Oceanobacillus neutriphilus]GGP17308.1 hypothetical protein GCM10011346_52640 [Oceanobacillus neutriphilus]